MLKDMKLDLQYFAESSGASETGSSDTNKSSSSSDLGSDKSLGTNETGKYTQEQMDKAMSNKDHEIRSKVKAEMEKSKDDEWTSKLHDAINSAYASGQKRANMTANQRREDDAKQRKAKYSSAIAKLQNLKRQSQVTNALNQAKAQLSQANIAHADEIAPLITSTNREEQDNNIAKFVQWHKTDKQKAVNKALSPKHNPSTGDLSNDTVQHLRGKSPGEMSVTDYLKFMNQKRE